ETFGVAYPEPNIGQVYVTLGRLEKAGLIRGQDIDQADRPNKRVYEITDTGRQELVAWFAKPTEGPRVRD
ncbi:PadR family transcriptional regulator, partial [Mangrovactinospora gilvigrisea]|uniref:PadR family transcriptional regulator n=1 Tax=Mangrovactinospora gilvigrisea TaxID=1428644 RepID=UPI000A422719